MTHRIPSCFKYLTVALILLVTLPADGAPSLQLGNFSFPTSGSREAQQYFLRGIGALHSFWYEEAHRAFQEAIRIQPDFLMGYWGEAMTYNHPVWREENLESARQVLDRIPKKSKATPREHAYVNALRLLYGTGSKRERDRAYAKAMERIYQAYPDDLEAACFYALSLLGMAQYGDSGSRTFIRAGAVALEVFRKNPQHPGAAHYVIHAFDDPLHAILALPAARQYAKIAPDAHHAQHMPAHIFLQLGMWSESADSNKAGWEGSVAWTKKNRLPLNLRDYHSLYWLLYTYLQQGRFRDAREILELKRLDMQRAGEDAQASDSGYDRKVNRYYDEMVAAFIVNTQQWELAGKLMGLGDKAPAQHPTPLSNFTLGFAVAMMQNSKGATALLEILPPVRDPHSLPVPSDHTGTRQDIRKFELAAAIQLAQGKPDHAITLLKKAVTLEDSLPVSAGPPTTVKPSHEFLGEVLLENGHFQEAREMFEKALLRHPNRARSLLGRARALAKMEKRESAREAYQNFLSVWSNADPDLPELLESRTYLQAS